MSVRYAMLGLLQEHPDYGYRLRRRFEERVGQVWRLNIGQVYQTLKLLEDEGLIRQVATQSSKQCPEDDVSAARRRFALTQVGKDTLRGWLNRRSSSPRPMRDELLVRLLVMEQDDVREALAVITEQEESYGRQLSRLLGMKHRLPERKPGASLLAAFGVEAAILHNLAHLKWLEHCRESLSPDDTKQAVNGEDEQPARK